MPCLCSVRRRPDGRPGTHTTGAFPGGRPSRIMPWAGPRPRIMPTNILRARHAAVKKPAAAGDRSSQGAPRRVLITAGRAQIRAVLLDTPTADRLWAALPIFSTAETWGSSVHFETPVETGRERAARTLVTAGDICFWSSRSRVAIGFGPTPVSRPGEIRMPEPGNVWARAEDDVRILKVTRPGERVSLTAARD